MSRQLVLDFSKENLRVLLRPNLLVSGLPNILIRCPIWKKLKQEVAGRGKDDGWEKLLVAASAQGEKSNTHQNFGSALNQTYA